MLFKKSKKIDDGRSIYVKKSRMQEIWHQFQKNKGAVVGLIMLIIIIGIAIVSGFVFDYKEDICARHAATRLIRPCLEHPFGTDQMGRSVLARVLYGTRYSLLIGIVVVGVSTATVPAKRMDMSLPRIVMIGISALFKA